MKSKETRNDGIVYSTEYGRMCPCCQKPKRECCCQKNQPILKGDGIVRILRETKGRKGKGVTIIKGLDLKEQELKDLAKYIKAKCGTGGTVKEGQIEIQGDFRVKIFEILKKKDLSVKF